MRSIVFTPSLVAALALFAAAAGAGAVSTLQEGYHDIWEDPNDYQLNYCILGTGNTPQAALFVARGFLMGSGTNGQVVRIDYDSPQPTSTSRNSSRISVKQSEFVTLNVMFDGVTATGGALVVEHCSVSASENIPKGTGSVSMRCSGGDALAPLTADQVASVQTAFDGRKDVTFKINASNGKWSLSSRCRGALRPD